jgi:predicted enzyme related to lactoylglutathione lyase
MSRVTHFEIHATNPQQLVDFYTTLLGWKFTKWAGPMEYWLIETGPADQPGINGGLLQRPHAAPLTELRINCFVCTAQVSDLNASLAKATQLGGQIALPRMGIPGVGWLAYIKDLDGNIMGLMQHDPNAK